MADDTSGPEPRGGAYGTVVVVGGGCYGGYYLRQLARGARAGAIRWTELLVVDRDASCAVTSGALADDWAAPPPRLVVSEWSDFMDRWLGAAAADPDAHARDAIVPSPLMPHLLADWIASRARARWPDRRVGVEPLPRAPEVPWERAAPDGTHYVSFADWICPINCIEPARCPVVRGPRWWSMPEALRSYAGSLRDEGTPVADAAVFHCTHRAYGVGMVDVAPVLAADRTAQRLGAAGGFELLVATASHCHGAVRRLVVAGRH
jgi:hypothetical protein